MGSAFIDVSPSLTAKDIFSVFSLNVWFPLESETFKLKTLKMSLAVKEGKIFFLLLFLGKSRENVHLGVDLVTKLSEDLFQLVFKEVSNQNENIILSPFGLLSNLAMVLEASHEETRQELMHALNISEADVASLRRGFEAYCDLFLKYSNEPEAAGSFNSASLASSFKLNATYKNVLQKYYCANVSESLPINETILELSNVAGVMSHWKDYDKLAVYTFLSHRSVLPFKRRDGTTVSVPMIPQVGVFRTKVWENSQVILIPLQAKLVNLLLIIPTNFDNVQLLINRLTESTIPLLVQSLPKHDLEVFIPQMAIVNKGLDLSSLLIKNGMRRMFNEQMSNLSRASSDSNLKVILKKIEQNAYFSTSFVALNSVSGVSSHIERRREKRETRKYYVDQPFLFFILQKDTQLVLLSGKVENPLQIPS